MVKLANIQLRSRLRVRSVLLSTAAAAVAFACSLYGFSALPAGATLVPTSTVAGSSISTNAIVCPTATLCLAGADSFTTSGAAIIKINGATGAASIAGTTAKTTDSPVSGLACPTATQCVAVSGVTYSFPVNGTNGKPGTVIDNSSPSIYYAVACPSATSCLAGGSTAPPFVTKLTPMSATGVPGTTATGGTGSGELNGLACVTATRCYGADTIGGGSGAVLVINSGGITSSLPTTVEGQAIACYQAASCVMVGDVGAATEAAVRSYAISVNPTTGNPGPKKLIAGITQVSGVTCATATTCIAVGYHYNATTHAISARYSIITNGVPAASKGLFGQSLAGVACPTATTCWAVGENHKGVSIVDSVPVA